MVIGLGTGAREMVGRIVGAGLRAQLPALHTLLSPFLDTATKGVLFGCWLDLARIEYTINLLKVHWLCSVECSHDIVDLYVPHSNAYIMYTYEAGCRDGSLQSTAERKIGSQLTPQRPWLDVRTRYRRAELGQPWRPSIICEDAFRASSILALEINTNETAVMLKAFQDGWIYILASKQNV